MLYFVNDYSEGAHEAIIRKLVATNLEKLPGYGLDRYSDSAKEKIRTACGCPDASVFFISGGTQTNAIVIDALLASYQGVIAADTGHISGHEAGAIERTGHKVITLRGENGKLRADRVRAYLEGFERDPNHEHMVFPGMVYISHPTELGTLYTLKELTALSAVCRAYHIPLYLDGARLGYALACPESDVSLRDIAALCDVFYFGGTKFGTLCGEAVIFPKGDAPAHFLTHIKQMCALLAKGRLLGVQFDALFENDLYLSLGKQAIAAARRLRSALAEKGYRFFIDSPTNQLFIVMDNSRLEAFSREVAYGFWDRPDNTHTVIRLCTSWATTDADVERLIALL